MHPRKKNEHGLTEREERFVRLLLDGKLLQREAYLAMNPAAAKWKTHVVDIKASLMAAKPHVQARFRALQAQLADVAVLKAADIMQETRRIALATSLGVVDRTTGKLLQPHQLDEATAATVSSIEVDDTGRVKKYRFWDKNSALDRGAKMLGMFKEDNEQGRPVVLVDRIELVPLRPLPTK